MPKTSDSYSKSCVTTLHETSLPACAQEVTRKSETAGALLGWVKALEACGQASCSVKEQLAQRNACRTAAASQEASLAAARPVLAGLQADLHALQVRLAFLCAHPLCFESMSAWLLIGYPEPHICLCMSQPGTGALPAPTGWIGQPGWI